MGRITSETNRSRDGARENSSRLGSKEGPDNVLPVWEWKQKTLSGTLTYVKITSSGINCILKNLRRGKSRSGKGY